MKAGLAKIIEKLRISRYFESAETDLHMAEIACCIDYANTWSSEEGHASQNAKVHIVVMMIMDVKTCCNSTQELLECAFRLPQNTYEWLKNPKYSDYRPLFTTQHDLTILQYVMEVLRAFR